MNDVVVRLQRHDSVELGADLGSYAGRLDHEQTLPAPPRRIVAIRYSINGKIVLPMVDVGSGIMNAGPTRVPLSLGIIAGAGAAWR